MTRVVERQFPFACFYAYIYVSYHTLIEPRTEKHISEVAFLQQYFSRVVSNITNYVGCMDVFTRPVHHYIYMYLQYIYTISCTTVTPNNCYSKQSRRNGLTLYPGVYFDLPCTQDIFSWVPNCSVGTPECEKKSSSKQNSSRLCENAWFPWQTIMGFSRMGVYTYKLLISQLLLIIDY